MATAMASSTSRDAEEHCDRAEDLLAVDLRGARKAGEHGGLVVVSQAGDAPSAGEQARAGVDCGLHLRVEFVELRGGRQRADLGVIAHGVADLHGVHGGDEADLEAVVDGFGDEEALGGDARLAAVDERAPRRQRPRRRRGRPRA